MADTLTLVAGTALAQIVMIAASPVLTRLYSPEQFGILSVFSVIVSMASVLTCLSYEPAILLPSDDGEGARILVGCLVIAALMAVISLMVILAYGRELAGFLGVPQLMSALWWVPLNLLALGAYQAFTYWNNRRQQFHRVSVSRVWQSGVTAATQIGGGVSGGGFNSLIFGQVLGQFMASCVLAVGAAKSRLVSAKRFSHWISECLPLFYRYRSFPLYSTWGTLMNGAAFQLVPLILTTSFGPRVAGLYFLAYRLVNIPMSFIGTALGQVLLQRASGQLAKGGGISRLVEIVVGRSILLCAPPLALFALVAPQAFSIAFGRDWFLAGRYVQVLTPLFILQLVTSPVSMVLIALQKQHVAALLQASLLLGSVGSLTVGGRYLNGPTACLGLYSLVLSMVYFLYLLAILRYASASVRSILREGASYRNLLRGF